MSGRRRLLWILAATLPVAVAIVGLRYRQAARRADQEARLSALQREAEDLQAQQAQMVELQQRKARYEEQIRRLEALRTNPGPRILAVSRAAESLGFAIDELSMSGAEMTVVYRAPSAAEAERLADALQKAGMIAGGPITSRGQGVFSLTARTAGPAS